MSWFRLVVFALCLLVIAGCGSDQPKEATQSTPAATPATPAAGGAPAAPAPAFQSLQPQDAARLLQQDKSILVVDVRTPQELKNGMIAGSVQVPFFAVMRGQHNLPRNRPLLVVCAVGGRSYAAGQLLVRQGYQRVYNLSGGMAAWKKARLPVVYP